jgi:hypothetical protein
MIYEKIMQVARAAQVRKCLEITGPGRGSLTAAFVSSNLSDKVMREPKTIRGRELRRGTPEERLSPGESLTVRKQGGKVFELKRVDPVRKSVLDQLDELIVEIPISGELVRTNLARIVIEERE